MGDKTGLIRSGGVFAAKLLKDETEEQLELGVGDGLPTSCCLRESGSTFLRAAGITRLAEECEIEDPEEATEIASS